MPRERINVARLEFQSHTVHSQTHTDLHYALYRLIHVHKEIRCGIVWLVIGLDGYGDGSFTH